MAIPMFNKNPLDPFGTNTLMSDIANTNQQVGLMNIPEQPSQQEQDFKRKQFGNMLLSFADVLKGRDPSAGVMQRTALLDAQKKEAEEKAKIEKFLATPQGAPYRTMYTLAGPKGVISAFASNRGQTYKPDLRTYKNVTKENIQIGNVILKPDESRPFNISNPTIANALMNTSGIDEVSKGTVYTRQGGLYDTPDGTYRELLVGDKQMFKGPGGTFSTEQFYAKYPANKISTTTSAEGYRYDADLKTFNTMNKDLVAVEKSMFQTENYWKNVKDSNVGISRLGDQISQWFTTLAGSKDLTPKELYRALAEGQLQGLIGANRIDTVGGGVMTEKDAWRVIARLGGDVDSLQNPAIVGPLLEEMYNLKVFDYNQQIKAYNNAVETGNFKGYEKREPITAEEVINKFSLLPENIPPGSKKVTINNQTLYQDGDTYYAVVNGEVVEVDIDG